MLLALRFGIAQAREQHTALGRERLAGEDAQGIPVTLASGFKIFQAVAAGTLPVEMSQIDICGRVFNRRGIDRIDVECFFTADDSAS